MSECECMACEYDFTIDQFKAENERLTKERDGLRRAMMGGDNNRCKVCGAAEVHGPYCWVGAALAKLEVMKPVRVELVIDLEIKDEPILHGFDIKYKTKT